MRYQQDYIYLLSNIKYNPTLLANSLGLVARIAPPEELHQFIKSHLSSDAAEADIEAIVSEGHGELLDRLAYLSTKKRETKELTRVAIGRELLSQIESKTQGCLTYKANPFISKLRNDLRLTDEEVQLLWGIYLPHMTRELDWLGLMGQGLAEQVETLNALYGWNGKPTDYLFAPDSKLIATGLLETNCEQIKIPNRVAMAISGQIDETSFQTENFTKDNLPVYDLESFDLDQTDVQIMLALLKSPEPTNILLYGKAGCGKTEAARTLIRAAGLDILHIPVHHSSTRTARLPRLRYASYFAENAAIILDEAEHVLNNAHRFLPYESDSPPSKSVLNTHIESSPAKVIWILNDTENIHESTLRRFHFKLHFEKLSKGQRKHAYDLIVRKHNFELKISPEMRDKILADEQTSPGILDSMMTTLMRTERISPAVSSTDVLSRLLLSNQPNTDKKAIEASVEDNYCLSGLNMSMPPEELLRTLQNFETQRRQPRLGLNLLFFGLPGTGKTEFARYVAKQTGRNLVIKRGSDLLGMYVGSTEKSIATAFQQAEANDMLLLIDEADTFFRSRESARQAYEVSHTNEFLNQLENHRGIVICCTNMLAALDPAALRRFQVKIEFKPIQKSKLADFFLRIFKDIMEDTPSGSDLQSALSHFENLTPGDFALVRQRAFLRENSISWRDLVSDLKSEVLHRARALPVPIGFR